MQVEDATIELNLLDRVFGVPRDDHYRFKQWSTVLTEFLGSGLFDVDVLRRAQETVLEMTGYFAGLTKRRCEVTDHRDDLISNFVAAARYLKSLPVTF